MKWIKLFENFEPIDSEVAKILSFIENRFKIKQEIILDKPTKYILVDDKVLYISGIFGNKKRAVNKIFWEISDELEEFQEGSIRKAIKEFINKNNEENR